MRKWIWDKIIKRWIWEKVTDIRRTENQMNYIKDMLKKNT
jgi:hypothetical protein